MANDTTIDATVAETPTTRTDDAPLSKQLRAAVSADWDPAPEMPHPASPDVAAWTRARREAVSALLPDRLVVVPSGSLKVRANDTGYPFRASSSFSWLTGETVEGSVLVMTPDAKVRLYVPEYAQPGDVAYLTDRVHGALWVGNVPSLADTEAALGIETRSRAALTDDLAAFQDDEVAVLTGIDPDVDAMLPRADSAMLNQALNELRLVKDEWELDRLMHACEITARGFADVVRELPSVVGRRNIRGERWLEGTFWRRARLEGNEVGYTSIIGSGRHATTLHWWRNHGVIEPGQLLLLDMGAETDELYTADVTRTLPVSGEWTRAQLQVYQAVLEAQTAGIAEVRAGADFLAAHKAAMWVLSDYLHSWGILSVPADVACGDDPEQPGAGGYRRYALHGTSHMLGIDVHDCAAARESVYRGGKLTVGNVLTVEPGLYFQVNDRTVPDELRGIGVRIEDDIAVTDGAALNLSGMLPRAPEDVTAWMRQVQGTRAQP